MTWETDDNFLTRAQQELASPLFCYTVFKMNDDKSGLSEENPSSGKVENRTCFKNGGQLIASPEKCSHES